MSPAVSVVMPVHNVRPYLDEAVESILQQTFSDFEFVILDDASTDGSGERMRDWAARDPRIRLIETRENLGPVGSSNMVAKAAKAPFVARMDADDISFPDRLSEEIALLQDYPDVGVVGSLCNIIDRSGRTIRGPESWRLSRRSVFVPFGHGTIMYRREVFDQAGGYRDQCEYWEDTSTLLTALNKTESLVYDILLPLMHAVIGGTIAICIVALLLFVAPLTAVVVATAVTLTYALVSALLRNRLSANSAIVETSYDARLQVVQESLGGIRDVIIDNSQSTYLSEFSSIDGRLADARADNQFIALAPRYAIETVGMIVIAGIAVVAARQPGGISAALPALGALALGAQRLLPLIQEVYSGWSTLEGQRSTFRQIIELLSLPVEEATEEPVSPLQLQREIALDKVSFAFPNRDRRALDEVRLEIPRGSMLALVGPTGSGKSTLLDVLMGLLQPDQGTILIDGTPLSRANERRWHRSIAHVPQSIFLADATIGRNIALSVPGAPNSARIIDSARKAQLHDFIVSLPEGYETIVGERGVRLSGGQRQRLGLARAIYKDAPVFILDEPTSALDDETERSVISALDELRREGRTIIIVAHRLSTIRHCDIVARLHDGRLVEVSSGERKPGSKSRARGDRGLSVGS